MKQELFDDLVASLNQALEYSKGDKTKARAVIVTGPDGETEQDQKYEPAREEINFRQ